jgi:hypothetical protein
VTAAQFFYVDQFVLLATGSKCHLHRSAVLAEVKMLVVLHEHQAAPPVVRLSRAVSTWLFSLGYLLPTSLCSCRLLCGFGEGPNLCLFVTVCCMCCCCVHHTRLQVQAARCYSRG